MVLKDKWRQAYGRGDGHTPKPKPVKKVKVMEERKGGLGKGCRNEDDHLQVEFLVVCFRLYFFPFTNNSLLTSLNF